jgi:hypothetical protein
MSDVSKTTCERFRKQLRDADERLLNGIDIASEVIDLIARGSDSLSSSGATQVQAKCLDCIQSIQECQQMYIDACESQAGVSIPYNVDGNRTTEE